jgi:hypothetical protein
MKIKNTVAGMLASALAMGPVVSSAAPAPQITSGVTSAAPAPLSGIYCSPITKRCCVPGFCPPPPPPPMAAPERGDSPVQVSDRR